MEGGIEDKHQYDTIAGSRSKVVIQKSICLFVD